MVVGIAAAVVAFPALHVLDRSIDQEIDVFRGPNEAMEDDCEAPIRT